MGRHSTAAKEMGSHPYVHGGTFLRGTEVHVSEPATVSRYFFDISWSTMAGLGPDNMLKARSATNTDLCCTENRG